MEGQSVLPWYSFVLSRAIQCKRINNPNFCDFCVEEFGFKRYCSGPIEIPHLVNTGEYIDVKSGKKQNTDCKDKFNPLFSHLRDVQPLKFSRSPSPLAPCYIYGVGPVNGPSKYSDDTRVTTWTEFRVNMVNQSVNGSQSTLGNFLDLMLPGALLPSAGSDTPPEFSMERLQVVHNAYHLPVQSNDTG